VSARARPSDVRRGFSMVELVLVLAILGIMAAVAVPRYATAASRYRCDAAARRIAADFALAQSQARTTSKGQSITFNLAASSYRMAGMASLNRTSGDYTVDLTDNPYCATLVSADFGGAPTVTFDAYGGPSSGGKVIVQAGSVQKTVTLNAYTGRVTVQ
jgi:type II secretion system protein H